MTPEARARLWVTIKRGNEAIAAAHAREAAARRGLDQIRTALVPGQAARWLRKYNMRTRP